MNRAIVAPQVSTLYERSHLHDSLPSVHCPRTGRDDVPKWFNNWSLCDFLTFQIGNHPRYGCYLFIVHASLLQRDVPMFFGRKGFALRLHELESFDQSDSRVPRSDDRIYISPACRDIGIVK